MISTHIFPNLIVFGLLYLVNGAVHFPNLIDITLDELISGLQERDFTSVDLVKAYTSRIREVNEQIKAVTELNPDALIIAETLDGERHGGHERGRLHGVPIIVKDNMATMDNMNNTAGSYALLGAKVPRDSTVVSRLRESGAIILGKGNMSQWASWRGNGSNGWSVYGGQCQGVYYPGQDPSGSSSGSAVASALGLSFAALGSETFGSLILPAQASNLVSIKPTLGLTSRFLVIPVSPRQDTIGPITRTVKDAATILQVIAGRDPEDNYTFAQPSKIPDYVSACKLSALSGARIGVPRNLIDSAQSHDLSLFNAAINTLTAAGATIVDNINVTDHALTALSSNTSVLVLAADFIYSLPSSYLSKLAYNPHQINSVSDLRDFTQNLSQEAYRTFPTVTTSLWDEGLALGYNNTSPEFWANYQVNLEIGGRQSILGLITNYSLDALIAPTDSAVQLPARIGSPVITVPLGFNDDENTLTDLNSTTPVSNEKLMLPKSGDNNPIGISFMGAKWTEAKLIGYAYAFEQKARVRRRGPQPYLMPKTQLTDVVSRSQNTSVDGTRA